MTTRALTAVLVATLAFASVRVATALPLKRPRGDGYQPEALRKSDVVENLGQKIPLDLVFRDEKGQPVALRELMGGPRPVILSLVYFRCPMLCNLVMQGLVNSLRDAGREVGRDVDLVTVSIDPKDTPAKAAMRRRGHLQALGKPAHDPSWRFLVGDEAPIQALAKSVGFSYTYDPKTDQYAHPAVLFVLSPAGKITRYLYGLKQEPRQLRLALAEASEGRASASIDRLLLQCYRYDPATRRYRFLLTGVLRGGGLVVFLLLGGVLFRFWRREARNGTGF